MTPHPPRHAGLSGVALLLGLCGLCPAHPVYMDHIEHVARLEIGPRCIDIRVRLTFNEFRSLAERRSMDADGDEILTSAECEAYLRSILPNLAGRIELEVDGRRLPVLNLYPPRLDLQGIEAVSLTHHVLELSFFARTPGELAPGSRVVLRERLWPEAPALRMATAVGVQGVELNRFEVMDSPSDGSVAAPRLEVQAAIAEVPARVDTAPGPPQRPPAAAAGITGAQAAAAASVIIVVLAGSLGEWQRRRRRRAGPQPA